MQFVPATPGIHIFLHLYNRVQINNCSTTNAKMKKQNFTYLQFYCSCYLIVIFIFVTEQYVGISFFPLKIHKWNEQNQSLFLHVCVEISYFVIFTFRFSGKIMCTKSNKRKLYPQRFFSINHYYLFQLMIIHDDNFSAEERDLPQGSSALAITQVGWSLCRASLRQLSAHKPPYESSSMIWLVACDLFFFWGAFSGLF